MMNRRRFLLSAAVTAPALAVHAQTKDQPSAPQKHEDASATDNTLPPSLAALADRRKDIKPITTSERETRLDLARELMKQYSIDAIIITTGASLYYFTGIRWGQSERMFAYVLPQNAAPCFICPHFERERLSEYYKQLPERESTLSYLWQEDEDPYLTLRRALAELNVTTGTLGIEERTQFAFVSSIAAACPALKIINATPVTAGCRSIKTATELALMKLANQITLDVYKAAYLAVTPGDTTARFVELVAKGYERSGVRGEASCNVGKYSAIPHGALAPQIIRENEMVLIDDGCSVDGYQSDISRSFVYGKPTDEQRAVFEIVYNAQSAALAAAGPGVPMEIIDSAARQVITKAGYGPGYDHFYHRVGHGIGLEGHEWPYLVKGNQQKLVAGMTFSDEPGIYIANRFGVRLEDDMFITDNGAQLFTPQSPSLQDPFAIPAVLPDKSKDAPAADAKPDTPKPDSAATEPKSDSPKA